MTEKNPIYIYVEGPYPISQTETRLNVTSMIVTLTYEIIEGFIHIGNHTVIKADLLQELLEREGYSVVIEDEWFRAEKEI